MSTIGQEVSTMFVQSGGRLSDTSSRYTNSQGAIIAGMANSAEKVADATANGNKNQTKEALIAAANDLAELRKAAVGQRWAGSTASFTDSSIKEEEQEIESQKQGMIQQAINWFNGQLEMNPFEAFKDMMRTALDGGIPTWLHNTKI